MTTLLIALGLLLIALFGAPLFSVIAAIALLSFHFAGIDTAAVIVEMYRLASAPTLLAIPLFTFAGYLLAESGTPKRLVNLSRAMFGWLPGGLAIVALGGLLFPVLLKEGYSEKFSLGLVTTSGSLGLLFPPSLPIILYGLVAKISIDQLFLAGIVPGLLLIVLLSIYSIRRGVVLSVPRTPFHWKELFVALRETIWEIPLPFIIVGGIYSGTFTATEAAAVTAFYVLVVEVFIYRDLKLFSDVPRIMRESMLLVGGILIILGAAMGLTNYLIDEQVPMKILEFMRTFIGSKIVFLILLNILLLIVGCMMDMFSAIIVVVPLIVPIAKEFGVDPVHLGIIFLANLEIGYFTPPVGLNLFISSFRFNKSVLKLYVSALPFLLIYLLALMIITYVPQLSLWLVGIFGR